MLKLPRDFTFVNMKIPKKIILKFRTVLKKRDNLNFTRMGDPYQSSTLRQTWFGCSLSQKSHIISISLYLHKILNPISKSQLWITTQGLGCHIFLWGFNPKSLNPGAKPCHEHTDSSRAVHHCNRFKGLGLKQILDGWLALIIYRS